MGKKARLVIMVLTSMLAAATVLWMQRRYEASDQKNALDLVETYRSETTKNSIPDLLGRHHPGRVVEWTTAEQSACYQHVRVHAVVNDPAGPVVYAFVVDINGPSIHPGNPEGEKLLAELDLPSPSPSPSPTESVAP
jgi:hypothetical protein